MTEFDYDVIVIGSGFGGSVSALRLTEKGYRVGVLEAGPPLEPADFPQTTGTSGSRCGCRAWAAPARSGPACSASACCSAGPASAAVR